MLQKTLKNVIKIMCVLLKDSKNYVYHSNLEKPKQTPALITVRVITADNKITKAFNYNYNSMFLTTKIEKF